MSYPSILLKCTLMIIYLIKKPKVSKYGVIFSHLFPETGVFLKSLYNHRLFYFLSSHQVVTLLCFILVVLYYFYIVFIDVIPQDI